MTERGLTSADGSPACPFVAFEDDRDERADRPDHRHRCFAEDPPAPRAHAHQEAYCLSSAFPVCPVFQDWARREAARARPQTASAPSAGNAAAAGNAAGSAENAGGPEAAASGPGDDGVADDARGADEWSGPPTDVPIESTPRRNPPRDWAAPPPWASPPGGSAGRVSGVDGPGDGGEYRKPRPAEGAGLVGSAADRLASGASFSDLEPGAGRTPAPTSRPPDVPSSGPDADLAGLVGTAGAASATDARLAADRAAVRAADDADYERATGSSRSASPTSGRGRSVSSTRSHSAPRDKPPQREHVQHDGPSWERARRSEAYPQIRSRAGMPPLPRIAVLAGALGIAAVALFFLPALLGVGGDGEPPASPSASIVEASPTPEPTPEPDPTPQIYTIREGDTLSAIAREFGLTVDQLLEANEDTISNPNRIRVGADIIIPTPPPDEVEEEVSPSAEP